MYRLLLELIHRAEAVGLFNFTKGDITLSAWALSFITKPSYAITLSADESPSIRALFAFIFSQWEDSFRMQFFDLIDFAKEFAHK
jgi:hypothetical protein